MLYLQSIEPDIRGEAEHFGARDPHPVVVAAHRIGNPVKAFQLTIVDSDIL